MTKFFHLPASCSSAVHAALTITQTPFDLEIVDLADKSRAFQDANPLGKVPALLDEGGAVFEGGAINLWLAAKNPESGLMPELSSLEGREALKWLFFCYATIHPIWIRLFFPQRMAGEGDHTAVSALAESDLIKNYGLLAEVLDGQDFLAGDAMSLADLYLAATLHWEAKIDGKLTHRFPKLAELKQCVLAVPAVKTAFAGEIA